MKDKIIRLVPLHERNYTLTGQTDLHQKVNGCTLNSALWREWDGQYSIRIGSIGNIDTDPFVYKTIKFKAPTTEVAKATYKDWLERNSEGR